MRYLGSMGMKILKIVHLFFAVMWIGAATCLLLLTFVVVPETADGLYMKSVILTIIDDYVIIPSAISCLLTGAVYGIWTKWGFFKHRWLIVKWVMTVAQILFGTFFLGPWLNKNVILVRELGYEAFTSPEFIHNLKMSVIWGSVQTALLVMYIAISVLKPWKSAVKTV